MKEDYNATKSQHTRKQQPLKKLNPFKMYKFKFKLSHDTGKVTITTNAETEQEAREKICRAENCPAGAMVLVKQTAIHPKTTGQQETK